MEDHVHRSDHMWPLPINGFTPENMKCRDPEYIVVLIGPHIYSHMSLLQKTRILLRDSERKPPMAQAAILKLSLVSSQKEGQSLQTTSKSTVQQSSENSF